jgi:hypothetical protein
MEPNSNPLLQPEDYAAQYKKNVEELRNNPQVIEWDRLCYELFEMNPQGKRWMEIVTERWIIPALARPGTPTYQLDVMFWEGYKEFGRMLLLALQTHKHRIAAGK